jgi:hypothetical protein
MTIRPCSLVTPALLAMFCLCGCVATVARADPTVSAHFQPLIGTRGSVHLIGEFARAAILRIDEN